VTGRPRGRSQAEAPELHPRRGLRTHVCITDRKLSWSEVSGEFRTGVPDVADRARTRSGAEFVPCNGRTVPLVGANPVRAGTGIADVLALADIGGTVLHNRARRRAQDPTGYRLDVEGVS
jgi:hypothetical protein